MRDSTIRLNFQSVERRYFSAAADGSWEFKVASVLSIDFVCFIVQVQDCFQQLI